MKDKEQSGKIDAASSNSSGHPLDGYSKPPDTANSESEKSPFYKSTAPSIQMPKGGGALKGIDEKFSVNAVNGTAGLDIALPLTPGRGGFTPSLSLSYSSGSGNSEFGLGWSLSLPSIQRKTGRKIPEYNDAEESDTFLLAGAEDLIPMLDENGDAVEDHSQTPYHIKRYRPRIEGLFARIERITKDGTTDSWWRVTTKDNITTYYGLSDNSRIADPAYDYRIYKWLPQLVFDHKGNVQEYIYKAEDIVNVPDESIHERNRILNQSFANKYLKEVRYCNAVPQVVSDSTTTTIFEPTLSSPGFLLKLVLDYGEHSLMDPQPDDAGNWNYRMDSFSDFHAGFEIRTFRKCQRVLMFHQFAELNSGTPTVVKSLDLEWRYDDIGDPELREVNYISSFKLTGWKWVDGDYYKKSLPPLSVEYSEVVWNTELKTVNEEDANNAPQGLTGAYQWIDLWGEGLSGILSESASGSWYYKNNLGDGKFTAAIPVAPKPSFAGLGSSLQWTDLDADGNRQVASYNPPYPGYFEAEEDIKYSKHQHKKLQWSPFRNFPNNVNVDFNSPFTKMLDLDGDGRADLLITEDSAWTWVKNKGKKGYVKGGKATSFLDEEKGPRLLVNDKQQTIFLADINGDGLTDLVRIRNGEVCYWANKGYGRFAEKVTMSNAPWLDNPEDFNPAYITLADITGTGAADLLYLGNNKCTVWRNLSGNGWSEAFEINPLPSTEPYSKIAVMDFLGNGTGCMVWSSPLPQHAHAPLRYIDLMGGNKPYLMASYSNGLGKNTELLYKSSTQYYLTDKMVGNTWATRLPFPVHCVEKVTTSDAVSETSYSQEYSYHHGYYDHAEREFRGFGRVDTLDTDSAAFNSDVDLDQPPVLTKTWFHTGAWIREQTLLEAFAIEYFLPNLQPSGVGAVLPENLKSQELREAHRALKGLPLRQEVYAADGTALASKPYTITAFTYKVDVISHLPSPLYNQEDNNHASFLTYQQEKLTWHLERNITDPRVLHEITLEVDEYGNVVDAAQVVYPRATTSINAVIDAAQDRMLITYTQTAYTNDIDSDAVQYRLRMPYDTKVYELHHATLATTYWLPEDLKAVFDGIVTDTDFSTAPVSLAKRLLSRTRVQYLENDTTAPLSFGTIESLGLVHQQYQLAFTAGVLTDVYASLVNGTMLGEGGYILADSQWWIPSGTVAYNNPLTEFYTPISFIDPWGNNTDISYRYWMLPESVTDELGNTVTVDEYDWRCLQPIQITDENANITEILYDALCLPVAVALKGKGTEGDDLTNVNVEDSTDIDNQNDFWSDPQGYADALLGNATWRCIYDFNVTGESPVGNSPARVAMIARQEHVNTPIGGSFSQQLIRITYTDGFGRVAMHKVQCADIGDGAWIASGKTVYNNKGNVVMQFEPYFSGSPEYDPATEGFGVSPKMYYDPLGRLYQTELPDGSFSYTEWTPWKQVVYDQNDTANDSLWWMERDTGSLSSIPEEVDARTKTEEHYDTPSEMHLDTLARPFYTIQHNRYLSGGSWVAADYESYVELDVQGNRLVVHDARGLTPLTYRYNPLQQPCKTISIDSGTQRVFTDVAGQPIYSWDADDRQFHILYDELRRPLEKWCDDVLLEVMEYGEAQGNGDNHNGKLYLTKDGAGMVTMAQYDFKGNPLRIIREFAEDYTIHPDWNGTVNMEGINYDTQSTYDALSRPVTITTPDTGITAHTYDAGGNLYSVDVNNVHGLTDDIILEIQYNAKGQRTYVQYNNNTSTEYIYDPLTYRLRRIRTSRSTDSASLQDINYWYDPVGNITLQRDDALQTVFYNNNIAAPENDYTYDALYRLIKAGGREHEGNSAGADADSWNDINRIQLAHTHDETKMRPYIQNYVYDQVGNMLTQQHVAGGSYNWTKNFTIDASSNRLTAVSSVLNESYGYDNRGNLVNGMSHLGDLYYNALNRLEAAPDSIGNMITYYQYDAAGQRVRKVTEDNNVNKKHTRKYIGGWEVYTRTDSSSNVEIERETLHIADDTGRVAIIDTPTIDNIGSGEAQTLRYQYSNHLGSATLELADNGDVISYEEYYPYGTTSFQSGRSTAETSLKRYRFAAAERDDETGLYYMGARYYIPWLCRWCASDPINSEWYNMEKGMPQRNVERHWLELTASSYEYCYDNPVRFTDPTGEQPTIRLLTAEELMPNVRSVQDNLSPVRTLVPPLPKTSPLNPIGRTMNVPQSKQTYISPARQLSPWEQRESKRLENQALIQQKLSERRTLDPVAFDLGSSPGVQAGLSLTIPSVGVVQGGTQLYSGLQTGNKTDIAFGALNVGLGIYSLRTPVINGNTVTSTGRQSTYQNYANFGSEFLDDFASIAQQPIAAKTELSFGSNKVGHLLKHRDVLGFGEIPYNQAQKMIPELESAANNLFGKMKLERVGQWSGYQNAKFYIGEGKMMITQQDGTFITTINKTSNAWFQKATPVQR